MITSTSGQNKSRRWRGCVEVRDTTTEPVSELEQAWEVALAEASRRAHGAGRADIARYLDLRRRNDLLRRTAIDWLNAVFTALVAEANRAQAGIQIERHDEHRFRRGSATMVGTQLIFRRGVRALIIESGWPRAPRDGIVRGDGLACANIKHVGRPRLNHELVLGTTRTDSPQWLIVGEDDRSPLTDQHLHDHISRLIQS